MTTVTLANKYLTGVNRTSKDKPQQEKKKEREREKKERKEGRKE